jgi:hypothetical protein
MKKIKKLSAYTHARYCCDITDVISGLYELSEAVQQRYMEGKTIPCFYRVRFSKLKSKLNRLNITNKQ